MSVLTSIPEFLAVPSRLWTNERLFVKKTSTH
jgi:hypothetical protein